MNHFKGTNETERFNNDLLNEIRKTNQLLEQILTNTKPQIEAQNIQVRTRGKQNVSNH